MTNHVHVQRMTGTLGKNKGLDGVVREYLGDDKVRHGALELCNWDVPMMTHCQETRELRGKQFPTRLGFEVVLYFCMYLVFMKTDVYAYK